MSKLTQGDLKAALHYDHNTGEFRWLVSMGTARVGDIAGWPTNGYRSISVLGHQYRAHILAWLYMTGEMPPRGLDHRDTDKSNNRWGNLRLASDSENGANRGPNKNCRSGVKGVNWDKARGKWAAYIMVRGKSIGLGRFATIDLAADAYREAAQRYFGEFARAA